jgi:hypothetical protein
MTVPIGEIDRRAARERRQAAQATRTVGDVKLAGRSV